MTLKPKKKMSKITLKHFFKNDQNNQKKPKTMIKKCPITLENDQNTFETLENY